MLVSVTNLAMKTAYLWTKT